MQLFRVLFCLLLIGSFVNGEDRKPIVIAHRGGATLRPENTLPAFQNALKLGVKVLEFDLNVTADGQVVLHHDSAINGAICRAPGIEPGPISLLKFADIRKFDCGSFARPNSPNFVGSPGAKMPTLDEFLGAVKQSDALLLGETKFPSDTSKYVVSPERFIDLVYPVLQKHSVESRFILQSAEYRSLDAMTKKDPKVKICLLNARKFKPDYISLAKKHKATHIMLRADDIDNAAEVQQLHAAGLAVYSGTANAKAEWQKYVELGMDGILTDDPQSLIQFLRNIR